MRIHLIYNDGSCWGSQHFILFRFLMYKVLPRILPNKQTKFPKQTKINQKLKPQPNKRKNYFLKRYIDRFRIRNVSKFCLRSFRPWLEKPPDPMELACCWRLGSLKAESELSVKYSMFTRHHHVCERKGEVRLYKERSQPTHAGRSLSQSGRDL